MRTSEDKLRQVKPLDVFPAVSLHLHEGHKNTVGSGSMFLTKKTRERNYLHLIVVEPHIGLVYSTSIAATVEHVV